MRKKFGPLFPAGPTLFSSGEGCVLGPGTAQLQSRPWRGWGPGATGRRAKQTQQLPWMTRRSAALEVLGPSCGPAWAGDFVKR